VVSDPVVWKNIRQGSEILAVLILAFFTAYRIFERDVAGAILGAFVMSGAIIMSLMDRHRRLTHLGGLLAKSSGPARQDTAVTTRASGSLPGAIGCLALAIAGIGLIVGLATHSPSNAIDYLSGAAPVGMVALVAKARQGGWWSRRQ
jgi:hypothetical protein